jgi:hypothetical protein
MSKNFIHQESNLGSPKRFVLKGAQLTLEPNILFIILIKRVSMKTIRKYNYFFFFITFVKLNEIN